MRVTVLFPTYRNSDIFGFALESILKQSHSDLEVFIYDNSFADGYAKIRELVTHANDSRVHYVQNRENFGSIANYLQLFRHAAAVERSVILPADCGLRVDALGLMTQAQKSHGAQWVRPRSLGFPVSETVRAMAALQSVDTAAEPTIRTVASSEVLRRFYSEENLDGELSTASWGGALIDGWIWQHAGLDTLPFRWHGAEQYVTMRLLLSDFRYAFLDLPLEVQLHGAPRFGTERPGDDYTRLETIEATGLLLRQRRRAVETVAPEALTHQSRALRRFLTIRKGYRLRALRMLAEVMLQSVGRVLRRRKR